MPSVEFTYSAYINFVKNLLQSGYQLVDFGHPDSFPPASTSYLVLRHDVDVSLEAAVKLAEREHEAGFRTTYFVMLSSRFYNCASREGRQFLHSLRDLGHLIGLHFDETVYEIKDTRAFNSAVSREVHELELLSKGPVEGVSFHRPTRERLGAGIELTFPLPHSYMPEFISSMDYCSDSTGRWRFGPPNERDSVRDRKPMHLLTHPIWWGDQSLPPDDRLRAYLDRSQIALGDALADELSVRVTG